MKFGTFHELEYPRPWTEGGEAKLFEEGLAQVELADRLGFHCSWAVEHHFLEEYSHCSAPEIFLAAAARMTRRIRLGHGVCLLPPAYNPPARVAERMGALDIISGGRLEFGTGESGSRIELEGFGIDPEQKRDQWTEVVSEIANMMAMDPYPGFQGTHFSMPMRNIVPKPIQKPHPPLWVACSNAETIHLAARLGIGALAFTFLEPAEAKKWVDDYYRIFKEECVPIGHTVNPNILLVTGFGVHRDDEVAKERFLDGVRFFQFGNNHFYREGTHRPGRTDLWSEYQKQKQELMKFDDDVTRMRNVAKSRGAIGSVDRVRDHIRALEATGIDQLVMLQQGGNNHHEHICESMELFAREIMPEFSEKEEEREARKMEHLAPFIEKAFARKKDRRPLRMPDEKVEDVVTIPLVKRYDSKGAVFGIIPDTKARAG